MNACITAENALEAIWAHLSEEWPLMYSSGGAPACRALPAY
jgi:hypothetical protein